MAVNKWDAAVPKLVRLQDVRRFSVRRTLQRQSVAEHTYNAMWVYLWLCDELGRIPCFDDMEDLLVHDLDEALTGDIPAPAKGEGGKDYSPWTVDELVQKLADKLEQWVFIFRERMLGNLLLSSVVDSTESVLLRLIDELNSRRDATGYHRLVGTMDRLTELVLADVLEETAQYAGGSE